MARTFGLIGTRPDLGSALVDVQLAALDAASHPEATWGIGFFEQDEVLLRRGRGGTGSIRLSSEHQWPVRTHAALAHECDGSRGHLRTEATPPLRYGHVLFSCQGVSEEVEPLVAHARRDLPEFLQPVVRGETLSELAFALVLAELPSSSLARTRLSEPKRSADPLQVAALSQALRQALHRLDTLSFAVDRAPFKGDLWLHTGELMLIAHREGELGLQVLRGRQDLARWNVLPEDGAAGLDQALFVTALAAADPLPATWERLPNNLIITAERGKLPETQAL